jgi:hypothetical protein
MDEYLDTRDRVNRASAEFLKLDVQTALTFLHIARTTSDLERQQRNRLAARHAYHTVLKLMQRTKLSEEDARTVALGVEQLKSELEGLGEVF